MKKTYDRLAEYFRLTECNLYHYPEAFPGVPDRESLPGETEITK
jgi:hypothetical protein